MSHSGFGFTIAAQNMMQYSTAEILRNGWRGNSLPTNGAAFPNTTPDKPYLTQAAYTQGGKETSRRSALLRLREEKGVQSAALFSVGGQYCVYLGYTPAEIQDRFPNDLGTYTLRDLLTFVATRRRTVRFNSATNAIIDDGAIVTPRPIDSVDMAVA